MWGYIREVSRDFHGWTRKFQGPFKQVSRRFQDSVKEALRVFLGSLKGVSRMLQRCFKEVSMLRCFKEVSYCMSLIAATRAEGGFVFVKLNYRWCFAAVEFVFCPWDLGIPLDLCKFSWCCLILLVNTSRILHLHHFVSSEEKLIKI